MSSKYSRQYAQSSLLEWKGELQPLQPHTTDPLLMSARQVAHAQEVTHSMKHVFTSNYSLTFVGMLGSAPPWRSSWTTELCPPVLALNTAVSPFCKEGKWRYMRYTICYHGDINVSYSSGTLWLTVRRILTLCAVHVECILYTRPCEH